MLQHEGPYAFITEAIRQSNAARTPWENKVTLRSFYMLAKCEPKDHMYKISVPILHICAKHGTLTGPYEMHKTVFDLAVEQRKALVA